MADRGVMFSAAMVQALLAGRKTQTRRLATSPLAKTQVGDRIWVRETWGCHWATDDQKPIDIDPALWSVRYPADGHIRPAEKDGSLAEAPQFKKNRPAIHMPRWASRLTLEVTDVRIQPLAELTDADAIAEGVVEDPKRGFMVPGVEHWSKDFPYLSRPTAREMYATLWDMLHGSGKWLGNPNVVALTFTVRHGNVDR